MSFGVFRQNTARRIYQLNNFRATKEKEVSFTKEEYKRTAIYKVRHLCLAVVSCVLQIVSYNLFVWSQAMKHGVPKEWTELLAQKADILQRLQGGLTAQKAAAPAVQVKQAAVVKKEKEPVESSLLQRMINLEDSDGRR